MLVFEIGSHPVAQAGLQPTSLGWPVIPSNSPTVHYVAQVILKLPEFFLSGSCASKPAFPALSFLLQGPDAETFQVTQTGIELSQWALSLLLLS